CSFAPVLPDTHTGKGRPATLPAWAEWSLQNPVPGQNPPARTLDAAAHSEPGTPLESTRSIGYGTQDSRPVAESIPFHLPPSAEATIVERNKESPTAGTGRVFRKRRQCVARRPDICLA